MNPTMALVVATLSWVSLACGGAVHPGLANAPALGGSTGTNARMHDVIANGGDSCGRHLDPGPLRDRPGACPAASKPVATLPYQPRRTQAEGVVLPWLEHFYAQWPCLGDGQAGRGATLGALWPSHHDVVGRGACREP